MGSNKIWKSVLNTNVVENITKSKGCNYYSVHSPREFNRRMVDEFDYMVTTIVFDLLLTLDSKSFDPQFTQ